MADLSPRDAAIDALLDRLTILRHDIRIPREVTVPDLVDVVLVAALDTLDASKVVLDAEYGWVGGRPVHGVSPARHPSLPRFVGAVLRAVLLARPECPICGSTKPGGTPSCDCDAHRDVPTATEAARG